MLRAPRQFQRLYDRCDACKRRIEEGMKPPPRRRITRRNTFELLEQRSLGDRIQFGEPIKVFGRLWRYTPREGWTPAE